MAAHSWGKAAKVLTFRALLAASIAISKFWFFGLCYAMNEVIRDETIIEKDIAAIFVNCFRSRTN
ncbi:MAG: hypothetical protein EWV55_15535 [Microcystis viridis Mv_BB_P_19951000_S69]|nr:MAG: hypothetical protein EWV55_15535 [Microcystis viridis Mv_BB_P_19951000_S69]TRU72381.1 MAG: hypothetical protein EWV47_15250 [Microcystis viridis Mv_BB_P_19951000_S68]